MGGEDFDISGSCIWEEGVPHPQWDLIETRVASRADSRDESSAWAEVGRQWLARLREALGPGYEAGETDHFLGVAPKGDVGAGPLLRFAEQCRSTLLSGLGGVADFSARGKQVVVALRTPDAYYRYISAFYPEGEHGGSAGVHIREGYPHVALRGEREWTLQNALAHELTHVSLHQLSMPPWLEEGLAQMFEHDMTGRSLLQLDAETAASHKRYWGKHGLDAFWRGEGFLRAGKVQKLSYELAEILVRLLVEEARPRWFGIVRGHQQRFFAFLRQARQADCGQEACRTCLGFGMDELAGRFLGPGNWSPAL
jgi:hypothetical protein